MTRLRHGYGQDAPPCVKDPVAFDWPDTTRGLSPNRKSDRRVIDEWFSVAQRICGTCPHVGLTGICATDALTTNPTFSGVAGGVIFHEGSVVA